MTGPHPDTDAAARAVDAVLYDFGNVLVGWDPYRAFDGHDAAVVETFFADVDFPALNHGRDAGATWAEARETVSRSHPHHVGLLDRYLTHFTATLSGPVEGSAELVDELRGLGVRLYGLTNWSAELFHHAATAAPATTRLDDVLVSGREGLAKPDPAIFRLAVERFGLDPRRTLFTDDSPANVRAAAALGLRTHLFRGTAGLRSALRELGVDVGSGDPA